MCASMTTHGHGAQAPMSPVMAQVIMEIWKTMSMMAG